MTSSCVTEFVRNSVYNGEPLKKLKKRGAIESVLSLKNLNEIMVPRKVRRSKESCGTCIAVVWAQGHEGMNQSSSRRYGEGGLK